MSTLTVVAYNVLFGDAILICIPERTGRKTIMRHILIDVGNVVGGPDSNSAVFRTVMEDIQRRLDGRPIDLYVMTHEHMDHVQGLLRLHSEGQVIPPIDYAWLTVSSDTNYYKNFPQAEKLRRLQIASYERIQRIALTRGILGIASVQSFLENNNPRRTADCVDFLRNRARLNTSYVHRGFKPAVGKNHPFRDVSLSIWAPELDTSSYYGRARPVMPTVRGRKLKAPVGVDQEAFDHLVAFSRTGLGDEMMAIDRAANNTSVVFSLEWQGWRLLFCGDAELRSWRTMSEKKQLRPVHFIKVGHHASHNATPEEELLDQLLPIRRRDRRKRTALVSTCAGTYNGVPDHDTLVRLGRRVDNLLLTSDVAVGSAVEISFEEEN